MGSLTILDRAREAGLIVTVEDGKLVISGPAKAESIVRELVRRKDEVLDALARKGPPSWEELSKQRWGPSLDHDLPPIIID